MGMGMGMGTITSASESVVKTAATMLFLRLGTSIPFSEELAILCNARTRMLHMLGGSEEVLALWHTNLGPYMEMRFRSLSAATESMIQKYANNVGVLEIASGLSQRGVMLAESTGVPYLDTDLNDVIKEKIQIFRQIPEMQFPESLSFRVIDVLHEGDIANTVGFFKESRIRFLIVICEGFLFYLTHDEKAVVTRHIAKLLSTIGAGCWITTDILTEAHFARTYSLDPRSHNEYMSKAGRQFSLFKDEEEARALFSQAGLQSEQHRQEEFYPISKLGLPVNDIVRPILSKSPLWFMRPG